MIGGAGRARAPRLHQRRAGARRGSCTASMRDDRADGRREDPSARTRRSSGRSATATVDKLYHALVQGHPDPTRGTIDAPIGRHPRHDWKFAVVAGGRDSVTHYETIEAFPRASLLEVAPGDRPHPPDPRALLVAAASVRRRRDVRRRPDARRARLGLDRQWLHAARAVLRPPGRRPPGDASPAPTPPTCSTRWMYCAPTPRPADGRPRAVAAPACRFRRRRPRGGPDWRVPARRRTGRRVRAPSRVRAHHAARFESPHLVVPANPAAGMGARRAVRRGPRPRSEDLPWSAFGIRLPDGWVGWLVTARRGAARAGRARADRQRRTPAARRRAGRSRCARSVRTPSWRCCRSRLPTAGCSRRSRSPPGSPRNSCIAAS